MQHGQGPYDRPGMQRGQEIHEMPADAPEPDPEVQDGITTGEGIAQNVVIQQAEPDPLGMLAAADVDVLVNAIWESSREMQVAMGALFACHVRFLEHVQRLKDMIEASRR